VESELQGRSKRQLKKVWQQMMTDHPEMKKPDQVALRVRSALMVWFVQHWDVALLHVRQLEPPPFDFDWETH
jgi:hypothetical protein